MPPAGPAATTADETDLPAWYRWFELTTRGSDLGRELRGGPVTFVTMAHVVVLNPLIIGTTTDISGRYIGGGDDPMVAIGLVSAAAALIAGIMTLLMGAVGLFPLAIAAGLGLNSFVAHTIAPLMTWPQAMGLIVLEGLARIPDQWFSSPDLPGKFSLTGAFTAVGIVTASLFVFWLLPSGFFDTMGTVTGLAHEAELPDENDDVPQVIVGFLMMTQNTHIPFDDHTIGIPAFLTIIIMPFTYSTATGIGAGMVTCTVLQVATERARRLPPLMWIVAVAFTIYFAIDPVTNLLTRITG